MENLINLALKYKNFYSSSHFKKVKNQVANCEMSAIHIINIRFILQMFNEQCINECECQLKRKIISHFTDEETHVANKYMKKCSTLLVSWKSKTRLG